MVRLVIVSVLIPQCGLKKEVFIDEGDNKMIQVMASPRDNGLTQGQSPSSGVALPRLVLLLVESRVTNLSFCPSLQGNG